MTGVTDWAAARARMVLAFIAISVAAGLYAYFTFPKEGAPNIDVPVLYISVPLPGVSALDSERLLIKPLETEMRGLDGLKQMTGIASENHAGMLLEFYFGWEKQATLAEVRAKVDQAKAEFPADAKTPTVSEINFSQFPILVVSLSGEVPERELLKRAKALQRAIESIPQVFEAQLTGHRDELVGVPGIDAVFAFSGGGGLVNKTGQEGPPDAVGQVQIELAPWHARGPGDDILAEVERRITAIPGVLAEIKRQEDGPQQGKPVQLDIKSDSWRDLHRAAEIARARFEATPGLTNVDDTRPLPGIDWQIEVDRADAGRFGADVATIGPLVQSVTRGAILDTYRPPDADEELDIRVRFPKQDRRISTLDHLKMTTTKGLVPLSSFIDRHAAPKLGEIKRRDGQRYFLIRADVGRGATDVTEITALERWIEAEKPFPASVDARFTGDREEQQKSQEFLVTAFAGALGLMFVILLAQFNSVYGAVLVLSAVVMSAAGVLIGMLVMGQKFSIIMTGTGIVALAGIVVNNNIVLIDTFQDFARRMNPLEAIVRTAEARIRPVLLTTVTTMAGLTPMMLAVSIDIGNGGLSRGAPTALWWVQLATAVVFGLGIATVLTLVVTPAALAARIWLMRAAGGGALTLWFGLAGLLRGGWSPSAYIRDRRLRRAVDRAGMPEIIWTEPEAPRSSPIIRATE